jgi:hypothetical protein
LFLANKGTYDSKVFLHQTLPKLNLPQTIHLVAIFLHQVHKRVAQSTTKESISNSPADQDLFLKGTNINRSNLSVATIFTRRIQHTNASRE